MWSYVNPLVAVPHLLRSDRRCILQLHENVENFGIHVFAGLIVVHFFTETFGAGTRSIVRNKRDREEDGDAARDVPGRVDAGLALPRRAPGS